MEHDTEIKPRLKLNNIGMIVFASLSILLVVAIGTTVYFYRKAHADPQKEAQAELQKTIKMVSKHMVLPKDESPTMAIVSDPDKLKEQRFFENAKKGNKVLIFPVSRKAILYDPVADRIIEVAPINVGAGTQ